MGQINPRQQVGAVMAFGQFLRRDIRGLVAERINRCPRRTPLRQSVGMQRQEHICACLAGNRHARFQRHKSVVVTGQNDLEPAGAQQHVAQGLGETQDQIGLDQTRAFGARINAAVARIQHHHQGAVAGLA